MVNPAVSPTTDLLGGGGGGQFQVGRPCHPLDEEDAGT